VDEFVLERIDLVLQLSFDLLGHRGGIINGLRRIPLQHESATFCSNLGIHKRKIAPKASSHNRLNSALNFATWKSLTL
jgi:hypothetical protein